MAGLIFDKAQIEQTIDAVVARTMRMDMTWDWPCGVAYYGICEAYEVTGKQEYLKLVQDRVDEYIELGLPEWTVNTCSIGHCLITLYEHTGDERYLNIAKSKVDYLETRPCGSVTGYCSTPSRSTTISPSRPGPTRCSWLPSSCCGWACCSRTPPSSTTR